MGVIDVATRIEMSPPKPQWRDDLARLRDALSRAVPAAASIHHIGSTAVSGLLAKNVIDIQVTVQRLQDVAPAALEAHGFTHVAHLIEDHCPPGMELAGPELAKQFFRASARPANVHVRERGRFNQRYPLLCRDYLRAHPGAARAYGAIKEQLARRFPEDAEAYYDIKDPVFDLIMAGAEAWALRTGWSEPPAD